MRALVLDGYTDEPACLGVPPYISPYVRLAFGALKDAGAYVRYATIDSWRSRQLDLSRYNLLAVIRRVSVPGKYLRSMPASDKELARIGKEFRGTRIASLGVSAPASALKDAYDFLPEGDLDAALHDLVLNGSFTDRTRTHDEWNSWLVRGAETCTQHSDHGGPLIAEIQMYRGCVRYLTGGCSFCVEPLLGAVLFREPRDILREAEALAGSGVRHLRLGAQSCVYCYMSEEVGKCESPRPNPDRVTALLRGVREVAAPDVFHLDNANPAVIADHPREAREITKAIVQYCTSGNVLAFGLESADPKVANANNLNASPEQTMSAIRLLNEIGASRGASGLPHVLPGINFLCGLRGESKETYELNLAFLHEVLREGLLLRRINIRQVIQARTEFPGVKHRPDFERFKRRVREQVDRPMLDQLVPDRTVLRSVFMELREGSRTFGRQVGTYPLLVTVPYAVEVGRRVEVAITGRSFRSVTGVLYPTQANMATLSMLEAVPGIGRRRAMSIVRKRPFSKQSELWSIFDEPRALESAQFHLSADKVEQQ